MIKSKRGNIDMDSIEKLSYRGKKIQEKVIDEQKYNTTERQIKTR